MAYCHDGIFDCDVYLISMKAAFMVCRLDCMVDVVVRFFSFLLVKNMIQCASYILLECTGRLNGYFNGLAWRSIVGFTWIINDWVKFGL